MDIQVRRKGKPVTIKVDQETLDRLGSRKISISGNGYAQVTVDGRTQSLHRWILGLPVGSPLIADHINRDVRDNRKVNLRAVTPTGSSMNRVIHAGRHGRGVKRQRSGRYAASLTRNRQRFDLGTYDTALLAAEAVVLFGAGPLMSDRAAEFRTSAKHTHTPEGRVKCRTCPR